MSRSFNKNFKIFVRVFSYDTTTNQIQFFRIVCTSAKNKFSYIVSTIVEFVTCCSLVVLFLPKSLLHSTNYWTLLPLQYLFFFSVIINTNLGATFRYPKPNNSATIHIAGELTIPSASKQWNSITVVLASGRFVRLFDYNHRIKERRFKATLLKIRHLSVPDYRKYGKGNIRRQEYRPGFQK